jgi:F-type H+-transporting ATPase subunit delta
MAELAAKRYAEALFEVGLEENLLDAFKDELAAIADLFEAEADYQVILQHPKVSQSEKKAMFQELFTGKITQEMLNFLFILVDKHRLSEIREIQRAFIALYHEARGIVEAVATTAIAMKPEAIERMAASLSKKMGKEVRLQNAVDANLIGGVLLRMKDQVIDGSLQGKLNNLQEELKQVTL